MIIDVTVPDIGEFKNIPVIEILVEPGDRVVKESPLLVLESDKATLDVPSPQNGVVTNVRVKVGDRVSVGSAILTLETASDETVALAPTRAGAAVQTASATAPEAAPAVVPASAHLPASLAPLTKASVITNGSASWAPRPVAGSADAAPVSPTAAFDSARMPGASPSVRRFARELGVDLTAVKGSGPRGRILKEDLQSFIKTAMRAPSAGQVSGLKLAAWPRIDFSKFGTTDRVPLTQIRKISGENLSRNWVLIPHVTNFEEVDITDLEAFRTETNASDKGAKGKLTLLAFIIKAISVVLKKFSAFNSSLDGDELILKRYFHIGFAADTPNGLVVPVIRDVDTKGIYQIANEAATLAAQARDGKLKLGDMQGGCFTVSSLGGIGGTGFTPIINAPEVAILGVTRAQIRPVWNGNAFQPRLILPLALSWDHRVVDGAAAGRLLSYLSALLADFRRVTL